MNINSIAKEMTREEFLDSITLDENLDIETINGMNKDNNDIHNIKFCPDGQGLKRTATCSKFINCKTCWEKAIENIKFKGENGMDIDITPAAKKAENMLNDLITPKIDYDREYNIMEIMEFPEETIFNTEGYDFKVTNGELRLKDNTGVWILEHLRKGIITSKFKLAKKDKKVSFEEAIQSYGKTIYCKLESREVIYTYCLRDKGTFFKNIDGSVTPEEILEGEWYIKED